MSYRFMPWATENFARVDADGNGFIAGTETDIALSNDRISLLERSALNHMRAAMPIFSKPATMNGLLKTMELLAVT